MRRPHRRLAARASDGRGEVVTIGTTDWVFGLTTDPAVAQVTHNVLRRYATS